MREPFTPIFFKQLQQLQIRTRRAFLGSRQGGHQSIRKGHGLEFSDFRAYAPGDDFRHIDWGVYGRTDRIYVREFREEQDLNVMVLLDTSASMSYPPEKFTRARELALALGYVALTDGDSVTFSMLGQKNSPRFTGARSIMRATKELEETESGGSFDLLTEVRASVARHRIPGKCFFISDLLFETDDLFSTLDHLRAHNFEIVLVQILSPGELELEVPAPQLVVDAETGAEIELTLDGASRKEYALELASHIELVEEYCNKAAIVHLLVSTEESTADLVLQRFPQAGILK